MAISYPDNWITRIRLAPKLMLGPNRESYQSPDGRQVVASDEVARRTQSYLREEARRRRLRKLNKDDEQICQDFVLIVDNWRTGHWDVRTPTLARNHALRARPKSGSTTPG